MRLALLCDDANAADWLDATSNESAHEFTLAATLNPDITALLRGRSGIRLTNHWEDLLGNRQLDVCFVGGHDPQILDAIKQLAASGQPLLFLPQAKQGSTFIYELGLVRDDNRVVICPAFWHRCDLALVRLRKLIHTGALGQVRLLQFEREIDSLGQSFVSQAAIDAVMIYDVDLLRWLMGDYNQVTALRTGDPAAGVLTQNIKLAGRQLAEATWNVSAGLEDTSKLTVHSELGRTVIEFDVASREWVLIETDGTRTSGNRQAAIREFLNRFESSLAAVNSTDAIAEWPELVKAFETVDGTHRSIARRRTIELHFEPMSERAIFKTQMTAIGCGVLIGTFLLVLVYLAIASTVPLPPALLFVLRGLVFAPLAIFLALQVLYPLTRPSSSDFASDNNDGDSESSGE